MSTNLISQIKENTKRADELMAIVKFSLESQREKYVLERCKEEEELKIENARLKLEVDRLKAQLASAEAKNGLKQIPMPGKFSMPAATVEKVKEPSSEPEKKAVPAEISNKRDKKAKEKKETDPKPRKQQAAGDVKPVDVSRLDMRVGQITAVKRHPDADSLYVEEVNLGEKEPRTIVSGLVKFVPIEQMDQRLAIFMCNLKPAKMRGVLSQGMIMCASTPDKVEVIEVPAGACVGDRVTFDGYPGAPDELLNPKKKVWEQVQPDLRISADGAASYKGALWRLNGQPCKAPTMRDTPIK